MKKKVKKVLASILAATLVFGSSIATASATNEIVPINPAYVGIVPFASPYITSTSGNVSSASSNIEVRLNSSYSGTFKAVVQKQSGSSWTDSYTIYDGSFSGDRVYKSKSSTLSSGTYRISVTVTISGTNYPTSTQSFTF